MIGKCQPTMTASVISGTDCEDGLAMESHLPVLEAALPPVGRETESRESSVSCSPQAGPPASGPGALRPALPPPPPSYPVVPQEDGYYLLDLFSGWLLVRTPSQPQGCF